MKIFMHGPALFTINSFPSATLKLSFSHLTEMLYLRIWQAGSYKKYIGIHTLKFGAQGIWSPLTLESGCGPPTKTP